MKEVLWKNIERVRTSAPLVQNITNYVVMNNSANALLAVGASPIMAHARPEMEEMVNICQSLVINIGTLEEYWVESMLQASALARQAGKPMILDPVGAGATSYRDETLAQLLAHKPAVIRGNASEIMALAKRNQTKTKGVDSTAQSNEATAAALWLSETYGSTVCISGATDIICSPTREIHLHNGDALMTKVTGLGCSATAVIGAFAAVVPDSVEATTSAMALFGVAGELAAKIARAPGSLQVHLLDKLYNLTEGEFMDTLKWEVIR